MPSNSGVLPSPAGFSYSRANLSPRITSREACGLARVFVVGERSWARSRTGIKQVATRMAIHFTCTSYLSGRSGNATTRREPADTTSNQKMSALRCLLHGRGELGLSEHFIKLRAIQPGAIDSAALDLLCVC